MGFAKPASECEWIPAVVFPPYTQVPPSHHTASSARTPTPHVQMNVRAVQVRLLLVQLLL